MIQKVFEKRFVILVVLQLILVVLLAYQLVRNENKGPNPERFRQIASKLHAAGIVPASIEFYEKYLLSAEDSAEIGKVALSVAELHEQAGNPEKALAWYYQAQSQPETEKEAAKKIVAMLEKLGKSSAAKSELGALTALNKKEAPKAEGGPVVAQVGDKLIYKHQIEAAIDRLPEDYQKELQSAEAKAQFVNQYVANEILYEKALRMGMNEAPDVKQEIHDMEKQVLVGKFVKQEIVSHLKIDAADLQNFYKAHLERYKGDKKKAPPFKEVEAQVRRDYEFEKINRELEKIVTSAVQGQQVHLYPERMK